MSKENAPYNAHPVGVESNSIENAEDEMNNPIICDTFAGKVHVEWDPHSSVTPIGQQVFFTQFIKNCGLYKQWIEECPLELTSPNASSKYDILGTLLLSVLSGQFRYSHITAIRHDNVNPPLLGMKKVLSEDSIRRAFVNIDEGECKKWQQKHLKYCYEPLLSEDWILDIDVTVKCLYGHQEGAKISYNPTKMGRPSQTIHTYAMAETRLILDCEVQPGNQHPSKYSLPRLVEIIEGLPIDKRPKLVRGDCAFGNDTIMTPIEDLNVSYLFKIKQTKKVKELRMLAEKGDQHWIEAGQGWKGVKAQLKLTGWTRERTVIILRRERKERKNSAVQKEMQLCFPFINSILERCNYEYSVLITNLDLEISGLAQLYRERATSENHFDELKNQWGWGGFVTQDIKRSQIMARIIAQIYNWWTLFVRWIEPDKHAEAITSRPLMLYGVGRATKHAGQTKLRVTSMHGKNQLIRKKLKTISSILYKIGRYAEQYASVKIWRGVLSVIFSKFLKGRMLGEKENDPEQAKLHLLLDWQPCMKMLAT